MMILLISLTILAGSITEYIFHKPKVITDFIFKNPDYVNYSLRQKKELFIKLIKFSSNLSIFLGIIGVLMGFYFLVYYVIGALITSIVRTIPEVREELLFFDETQKIINELNALIGMGIFKLVKPEDKDKNEKTD